MEILFIISVIFSILINAGIFWLIMKAADAGEFNHSSIDRIRLIKELEMIESIDAKYSKNKNT